MMTKQIANRMFYQAAWIILFLVPLCILAR